MTVIENDMTSYNEDDDPRENAGRNDIPGLGPLGEAPWLLQVSIKTMAGTLINIRGMNGWDIASGLESIAGLANQIQETESKFGNSVPPALTQQLGARPAPPQVQQQAAPQQQQGTQPTCYCGFPARFVPGGISKRTQQPYRAFYACGNPVREAECKFRANG